MESLFWCPKLISKVFVAYFEIRLQSASPFRAANRPQCNSVERLLFPSHTNWFVLIRLTTNIPDGLTDLKFWKNFFLVRVTNKFIKYYLLSLWGGGDIYYTTYFALVFIYLAMNLPRAFTNLVWVAGRTFHTVLMVYEIAATMNGNDQL